jgi:hypothetical protein
MLFTSWPTRTQAEVPLDIPRQGISSPVVARLAAVSTDISTVGMAVAAMGAVTRTTEEREGLAWSSVSFTREDAFLFFTFLYSESPSARAAPVRGKTWPVIKHRQTSRNVIIDCNVSGFLIN